MEGVQPPSCLKLIFLTSKSPPVVAVNPNKAIETVSRYDNRPCSARVQPLGLHAILDTPRGSASLAPAVAANPKTTIGTASGGVLNPTQSEVIFSASSLFCMGD